MAIAHYKAVGCFIDGKHRTAAAPGNYTCGLFYLGATKDQQDRLLLRFDLSVPSEEGYQLSAGSTINEAHINENIQNAALPSFTEQLKRLTRTNFDYVTASFNKYDSVNDWTTAGGDVDIVTPPQIEFTSPGGFGDFAIAGLDSFVSDALANRGGILAILRMHKTENSGITQFHTAANTPDGKPTLRVDFARGDLIAVDNPQRATLAGDAAARAANPQAPARAASPAKAARR